MKLKGKNVFVTGGSRGIGKAICLTLANEGANIAFSYQNNDAEARKTSKMLKETGVDVKSFQCDVRDRDGFKSFCKS